MTQVTAAQNIKNQLNIQKEHITMPLTYYEMNQQHYENHDH